jgi:sulfopyruvate decarboxylase subunit beta
MTEEEAIRLLLESSVDEALVVANGYISRQVCHWRDLPANFYMIGSMGLALSIGLGLALAQPRQRVVVVDGDGNLLMSLGTMATVGHQRPENLSHIVIDNQAYASTGGQRTNSGSVSICEVALAAGYRIAVPVCDPFELRNALDRVRTNKGPSLTHIKVRCGAFVPPRVSLEPEEIAQRFRRTVFG